MSHPPIGIDLGTTNSLISVFRDGQPELISTVDGALMTPSAVAWQDGQMLVGQAAWDFGLSNPDHVAVAFKRMMGTDKTIRLGRTKLSAPELSSFVLKKLKADAEAALDCEITHAVVTVPAYFNQLQREATQTACRLAGITPLSLINEPTAAALAYGLQDRKGESEFLVFDLGGGTFDVTVLEHFDGVMEVKASSGDAHLGGEDFTNVILTLFLERLNLTADKTPQNVLTRLRYFAEQAKRKLSSDTSFAFSFELNDTSHEITLSPQEFEEAAAPLVRRLRAPIQRCLYDNDGQERALDRVILVGGSTRMPLARKLAAQELRLFPDASINPDHAVALGAAVQAALIGEDRALDDVVMTDVSPFSVGIEVGRGSGKERLTGLFSPIVERNTPLPASRVEDFVATQRNQKEMRIGLYQGESAHVVNNVLLGEFRIALPAGPDRPEFPTVSVRITQDISGLIEVIARVGHADIEKRMTVETNASHLSDEEIQHRMRQLDHLKIHPREDDANRAILNRLDRLYEMATGDDRDFLADKMAQFKIVLEKQDPKVISKLREELTETLNAIDAFYVS